MISAQMSCIYFLHFVFFFYFLLLNLFHNSAFKNFHCSSSSILFQSYISSPLFFLSPKVFTQTYLLSPSTLNFSFIYIFHTPLIEKNLIYFLFSLSLSLSLSHPHLPLIYPNTSPIAASNCFV